jgi:RNA polymerase sigma factor (sigma-70 family)
MDLPPFQALFEDNRTDVYAFLVALVGSQDAEDCWQETWLSALRSYPKLKDSSNLRSWVMTIAHRKALDALRRRRRREPQLSAEVPDAASEPSSDHEPVLWALLRRLPPKQRSAVFLRVVGDMKYVEVASIMDCSEDAARQSARQGLNKLREELRT